MADYDLTTDKGQEPAYNPAGLLHYERVIDFSDVKGDGSNTNLASSDTAQLFDLPAGIWVIGVMVETLKVEGGTATIDLGVTGGDVDKYMDGVNINGSAGDMAVSGDASTSEPTAFENNGVFLSAAETVSLLANNALDTAVIRVVMKAMDMRGQLQDPTA